MDFLETLLYFFFFLSQGFLLFVIKLYVIVAFLYLALILLQKG